MTPEVEVAIKNILLSKVWDDLSEECSSGIFDRYDGGLDGLINDLNIENILEINNLDGLKKINFDRYSRIVSFFPRSPSDSDDVLAFGSSSCTRIANQISTMFGNAYAAYSTYALIHGSD